MSFRGEQIHEAVRDIMVGGGESDLALTELVRRVQETLGFTLTPEQRDFVRVCRDACAFELQFP